MKFKIAFGISLSLAFFQCKSPASLQSPDDPGIAIERDSIFEEIFAQRLAEAEIPVPKGFAGRDVVFDSTRFSTVPVYYTTDRRVSGKSDPYLFYSGKPDPAGLHFGKCMVTIPAIHEIGEIERPGWWKVEFTETPEKHITLKEISPLSETDFFQELRLSGLQPEKREALVFIHGFNVSFGEAALRAAQLAYDVSFVGIPVFYSWPSTGNVLKYGRDGKQNASTISNLEYFLETLAAQGDFNQIHIVAHSMGNQALTRCLMDMAQKKPDAALFGQIVLAAPDVDAKAFVETIAPVIGRTARNITLYASDRDKALQLSEKINKAPRAGEAGEDLVVVAPIETIDASEIDTDFLGHSYFANTWLLINDLHYLLNQGLEADERNLRNKEKGNWKFWFF